MRRLFLAAVAALSSGAAAAQLTVGYHYSNLPFVAIGYELLDGRLRPEARFGTDNLIESTTVEIVATYAFYRRADHEAYAGAGARFVFFEGVPLLLGVRAYPFASERFGVQLETAGIVGGEDGALLRGSLGVQVRLGRAG